MKSISQKRAELETKLNLHKGDLGGFCVHPFDCINPKCKLGHLMGIQERNQNRRDSIKAHTK